ncbi:hypothetical protein [Streptomyces peucetius]|uniref:Uncharacterized protein n=1 Tax=Streptomyces peucetius TaxID=1950 RepID=A0ABY6I0D5_STRPE|nr:hypothetical protein [Streptomyces peucetius]UYQ60432.1 hypothetical protein OGH68_02335 [Streptomyces peucetius]
MAGVGLRHLLMSQAGPLVEPQAAPTVLDVEAREVGILAPTGPRGARTW